MSLAYAPSHQFARTRIFPNGECVIFRDKISKCEPLCKYRGPEPKNYKQECWELFLRCSEALKAASFFMGLSLLGNFDKLADPLEDEVVPSVKVTKRYGTNGITRLGARTVRNCAHLLQERFGKGRLTFATVTLPNLPRKQMRLLHQSWYQIVERYRLLVRRELKGQDLPSHLLTVSEIQTKRHKKSGIPVLHLHSLWVGRLPYGAWGVTTKRHDDIWRKAVGTVIDTVGVSFKSAANLKEVQSSAGNYLGKYMSKGGAAIADVKKAGFEDWLPRQWWNCTRELVRAFHTNTVEGTEVSEHLLVLADCGAENAWDFVGRVHIELDDERKYWVASFGRLNTELADYARRKLGWQNLPLCDTL